VLADRGDARRRAQNAQLVLAAGRHALQVARPYFQAAAVGVAALQHQYALLAAVPVLRKGRAGREVQQACALATEPAVELDVEDLQARQERKAPLLGLFGARELTSHQLFGRLPERREPTEERGVTQRQLGYGSQQALAHPSQRFILRQLLAKNDGRFRFFHGPCHQYDPATPTDLLSFRPVTARPDYLPSPEALKGALAGLGAADLVLLAAHALRVGSPDYAAAICESHSGGLYDAEPALRLCRAAALFGSGEHARAIALVDGVLVQDPAHLAALFYRAQMAQHVGDAALATELLLVVLDRFPDFPGAQGALASLRFPGAPYRDVLRRMHELVRPRSYLEIGVETGATLAFAHAAARAIGVDPDASKLRRELVPANARVFHETSDAFFARQSCEQALGGHKLDLAFIDGMHLFEYALRDFMNVEAWSEPNGVVVLHDCLPVSALSASRERRTNFWVGDVWKVVSILREYRPELRVKLVATAPSGLCVVRGLDPASRVLWQQLDAIVERYRELPYPANGLDVPAGFELVPASETGLREALQ